MRDILSAHPSSARAFPKTGRRLLQERLEPSNFLVAFQPFSEPLVLRMRSESLLVESNGRLVPLHGYDQREKHPHSKQTYSKNPPFDSTAVLLSGDSTQVSEQKLANSSIPLRWCHVEVFQLEKVFSVRTVWQRASISTYVESWSAEPCGEAEEVLGKMKYQLVPRVPTSRIVLTSAIPMTSGPSLARRHSAYFFSKTFSLI